MLAFRIKSSLRDLRHERRDSKRLRGARFLKRNVPCVSRNRMLFNLALGRYFRLVDFTVIVYQRVMATRYCLFTRKVEGTLTCSPCLWNEVTTSFTTNTREKIEMNRLNHNYPESCVSQRFRRWIVPKVDYIYIYIYWTRVWRVLFEESNIKSCTVVRCYCTISIITNFFEI